MKKLLFGFLLLFAIQVSAQEHLKFLDIPIVGTLDNFQKKLVEKGYRNLENTTTYFTGNFGGSEALIQLLLTVETNNIYGVNINTSNVVSYTVIQDQIKTLVLRFESKYNTKMFQDENGTYTLLVKKDKTLVGGIFINQNKLDDNKYCVNIQYIDSDGNLKNSEIENKDL